MNRRMGKRKLTRLILAALLSTGGGLCWSSAAEAASDTEVNANTEINSDQSGTGTGGYELTGTGITFTVANGGKIKYAYSALDGNTFNLMSGGTITGGVSNALYGGAKNNILNLYGTVTSGQISGGRTNSPSTEISGNNVNIFSEANIASFVYGGYDGNYNTVTNNTVTITGGTLKGTNRYVYGGYGTYGTATNNTVTISGDTTNIEGSVCGGGASGGTVKDNTVIISGGTVGGTVMGGMSNSGNATGNTVTVGAGATVGATDGGVAGSGGGTADNNTVIINGGTITDETHGGFSYSGAATNNKLTINNTDASINSYMQAGRAQTDATGNIFTVNGGEIGGLGIAGGYAATGKAEGNQVVITNGTINTSVVGGAASRANNNTVTISGGTVGDPNGWAEIRGGEATSGAANNNTVTISGGTINNDVWGGSGATADGNTVTISGNTVFLSTKGIHGASAMTGDATNNTVNILTTQPITFAHLYGGLNETGGITSSGNTLNLAAKDVTVGTLDKFQNMNFYLPSNIANDDTMLTVTGGTLNSKTNLTGVAIGAAVQSGATLVKGNTVNLITNPNGLTTDSTTTMKQITDETVTIQTKPEPKTLTTDQSYTLEVSQKDDTTIIATVTNVEEKKRDDPVDPDNPDNPGGSTLEEKTKSLVETRAATTTFVNAGADMLASQGFMQAANAVALDAAEAAKNGTGAQNVGGFTPFAAFGGSGMRAESGSHVDTKGYGINVGFAREIPNSQGKLLFGPVVEYGGGSYDSHLDDGTRGEGGAHYFGVGLMARQVNHNGFYYEGSVRGGRVTSDYESNDVVNNRKVGYDSSSNYWAAHLGVGKAMNVGGSNTVDAYLKYFYSHQSGDDVAIKFNGNETGDRGNFDSVDSNRIRIGARLTHKINDMNSIYGGLAYQYEFGGEARAHFTGVNETPSPSVKGSSGMLELGWQVKPGGPVTIDLGVTGWAGKQRGGSVQLGATWTF